MKNIKMLHSFSSFIVPFCACLSLALTPTVTFAAQKESGPPWYEVEVIIFLNNQNLGPETETWDEQVSTPSYDNTIDLALPGMYPSTVRLPPVSDSATKTTTVNSDNMYDNGAYTLLPGEFLQLTRMANKLNASSEFDVVLHIAWRQPTYDTKQATPIFVFDGMTNPDPKPTPAPVGPDYRQPSIEELESYGPKYHRLSGTLKLSVSRYLHLESDLHIKQVAMQQEVLEEAPPSKSGGFGSFFGMSSEPTPIMIERQVLRDYPLFETRRMRSKELHYFDHPKMGIVVKVTPFELEVEPEV
ncbi:CsiV family protein, partial [Kaarinaea lacus]